MIDVPFLKPPRVIVKFVAPTSFSTLRVMVAPSSAFFNSDILNLAK